jgi:hypothetical protein
MADRGTLKLAAAPTPLTPDHDLSSFSSGVPALDDWLRRRALANQYSGASRMFVAENAAAFYLHHGFVPSPMHACTLMLRLHN